MNHNYPRAEKVGGSYQASGTVVSTFKTLAGETRHVFEFDQPAGMLHIFGPSQLRITAAPAPATADFLMHEIARAAGVTFGPADTLDTMAREIIATLHATRTAADQRAEAAELALSLASTGIPVIERYKLLPSGISMTRDPQGDYVKYSDHVHILKHARLRRGKGAVQ